MNCCCTLPNLPFPFWLDLLSYPYFLSHLVGFHSVISNPTGFRFFSSLRQVFKNNKTSALMWAMILTSSSALISSGRFNRRPRWISNGIYFVVEWRKVFFVAIIFLNSGFNSAPLPSFIRSCKRYLISLFARSIWPLVWGWWGAEWTSIIVIMSNYH